MKCSFEIHITFEGGIQQLHNMEIEDIHFFEVNTKYISTHEMKYF